MFGTLGFSELILILAIILIIFGAGRLPQIGEGIGKALKGFKKEVNEPPPPMDPDTATQGQPEQAPAPQSTATAPAPAPAPDAPRPTAPYQPGPELTPGTTAALMASAAPQVAQPRPKAVQSAPASPAGQPVTAASGQPPTMEDRLSTPPPSPRGVYPPLPPSAQPKPAAKRPSAVVNKDAVARVQAQQAAMRAAALKQKGGQDAGLSSQDMQGLGESLGDTLRTFRQAAADVRNAVDPEMRTIRAELDAAQKEVQQSIEAAKEMPAVIEDPPEKS
jgi:TatA/E family protein of Tat protein translocase